MTFLVLNYFVDNNMLNFWNIFFFFFSNFLGVNSVLCFYVKNPVFSLIFLIINYLMAATFMLIFGMQFLVFVFLLVYVGAVSILLLFTLMLLNLKIIFYKNVTFKYFFYFCIFVLFFEFFLFFYKDFFNLFYYFDVNSVNWFSTVFFKNEIANFGIELFLFNKDLVFLSAVFLFSILIASINIVLTIKYSKKQSLSNQLKNLNKNIKK